MHPKEEKGILQKNGLIIPYKMSLKCKARTIKVDRCITHFHFELCFAQSVDKNRSSIVYNAY